MKMDCEYVIDTYAWIEYFKGTSIGQTAKQYIEGNSCATPSIVILELERSLLRDIAEGNETKEGANKKTEYVRSVSAITDLTYDSSIKAAQTDHEMRKKIKNWGMADSIVLATARQLGAKVVTGDEHFRGLADTVLIK
jgi:predicted nucleic acid-binding protein